MRVFLQQDVGHGLEIILQTVFLEVDACRLQKTIFEVVQVPQHGAAVEGGLRIALAEVQPFGALVLQDGQQADDLAEELEKFCGSLVFARLCAQLVEEERVAQVFLQIVEVVVGVRIHLGHGQALLAEVVGQVDERAVLFG